MVMELNMDTWEKEVVQADGPVIVDFWASWCGPCRMMAPVFEEVSGEYAGKLKFAKISTEEHPEAGDANQVRGIPCLIVFKGGKEVDRIVGYMGKDMLKSKIDEILGKI